MLYQIAGRFKFIISAASEAYTAGNWPVKSDSGPGDGVIAGT